MYPYMRLYSSLMFEFFEELPYYFPIAAAPIFILTNSIQGSLSFTVWPILSSTFLCGFFGFCGFLFFFFFFGFLGLHLRHIEVPRLRVKTELQVLAYTTAAATWDLSCICDLHCNPWQHWILNPLREARDRTCILMDASWAPYRQARTGTQFFCLFGNSHPTGEG